MKTQCTEVFWIRLQLATFDDPRWLVIEQLPEAEAVENIYTRLLMLAGKSNANGFLLLYDNVPYTLDSLSAVLRRKKSVVELALNVLIKFDFVELLDDIYAVLDWERLQFTDELAKIAERREKDKIRHRINRKNKKLLSAYTSTDSLRKSTSTETETKLETNIEIENNNQNVVALAESLLQKNWPQILSSETAIEAVVQALVSHGEEYVYNNVKYARLKAKTNPTKYLIDALSHDYAAHQSKSSQIIINMAERERKAEEDKRLRAAEDEMLRQWHESPEGQAERARLLAAGIPVMGPAP